MKKQIILVLVCAGILLMAGCTGQNGLTPSEEEEEDIYDNYKDVTTVNTDDDPDNDKEAEAYPTVSTLDVRRGETRSMELNFKNEDNESFFVEKMRIDRTWDYTEVGIEFSWNNNEQWLNVSTGPGRRSFSANIGVTNVDHEPGVTVRIWINFYFHDSEDNGYYVKMYFDVHTM